MTNTVAVVSWRGAEGMIYICRQLLPTLALAGGALLIMGAGSETISKASNTASSGPTSTATTSLPAKTDAGIKTKPTDSTLSTSNGNLKKNRQQSILTGNTVSHVLLPPHAEELARSLQFDRRVLLIVKDVVQEHVHIHRLIGYDENGYQIKAAGIMVPVQREKADQALILLRKKLAPLHYMPFIVEMNQGLKMDKIGIIKGTDQYEILRIMNTDGDEDEISNQDIIDRLKEWKKISSFDIIGADNDRIEIEFKTLPKNLRSFAEEVGEFCPSAVTQGPGSIKELVREIALTHRLLLIWD